MKNIPAFPSRNRWDPDNVDLNSEGMTLRDYFAAKAMQGMIASGVTVDIDKEYIFQTRAETAYAIADAMMKARDK